MVEVSGLRVVLFVMDTGPLITLAAAGSLDYLQLPGTPVYVPDAVFYEATIKADALGAQDILAWVQQGHAIIVPTQAYSGIAALLQNPEPLDRAVTRALTANLGERAALEAVSTAMVLAGPEDRAVLIAEDDPARRSASLPPYDRQVIAITTRDFLETLEQEGRINSADQVYARADAAGRNASRKASSPPIDQASRKALQEALARRPLS